MIEWLPDDPYPRAMVELWPDEPGDPVTRSPVLEHRRPDGGVVRADRHRPRRAAAGPRHLLGYGEIDARRRGERLFALASRLPIGAADRYAVLSAPSAADRLAALSEAVDTVAAMVEFQLSE